MTRREMIRAALRAEEKRLYKLYGGEKVCVLCGKTFTGLGNNPSPLAPHSHADEPASRCCNECDGTRVLPARRQLWKEGKKWEGFVEISPQEVEWFIKISPWPIIVEDQLQEN